MSEGINLQDCFDAVVHYDLPWNPNRLEQREGRVDRFGQRRTEVKAVLLYGANNPVDQVVLDVLIRKARKIRRDLGISVPVPGDTEQVIQTVVDNVLLRRRDQTIQLELTLSTPDASRLHEAWDEAAEREKRQRGYFDQHGIKPDEVSREIEATDAVLGDPQAVRRFLADALQRFGGGLVPARGKDGVFLLSAGNLKTKLQDLVGGEFPIAVTFDRTKDADALYLGRTQPLVARVCDAVLGEAFSIEGDERFSRAGAMFTDAVKRWTALMLLRLRYRLVEATEEFAEEIVLAAFGRSHDGGLQWLEPYATAARHLADSALPAANITREERSINVQRALDMLKSDPKWFRPILEWRVGELEAAHRRLRALLKERPLEIRPHTPPDILGLRLRLSTIRFFATASSRMSRALPQHSAP
jgi:hypothetical protein